MIRYYASRWLYLKNLLLIAFRQIQNSFARTQTNSNSICSRVKFFKLNSIAQNSKYRMPNVSFENVKMSDERISIWISFFFFRKLIKKYVILYLRLTCSTPRRNSKIEYLNWFKILSNDFGLYACLDTNKINVEFTVSWISLFLRNYFCLYI